MNSYFFMTGSDGGTPTDPATAICEKYQATRHSISIGINVAVCAIDREDDPHITEIVQMKTRQEIIDLVHPQMPDFNGAFFIMKWEQGA